jgi:cytochrome P450
MKSRTGRTASSRLPRRYAAGYGAGCALVALSAVCAVLAATAGMWTLSLVLVAPVMAVAIAAARRVHELRTHRHIPGPIPSFFTGNLRDIQAGGHGVRDTSLVALHQEYGPVVRLHLPWGTSPMVSLDYASKNLHSRDLDSFRDPDRTLLKGSLMGLVGGPEHRRHRQVIAPAFTRAGVGERRRAVNEVTEKFVHRWADAARVATAPAHPKVSEIQNWSAHSLGVFLFGNDWDATGELEQYLDATHIIEEEASFRALHPSSVRWLFIRRTLRARAAYRYLYGYLSEIVERRRTRGGGDGQSKDVLDMLMAASDRECAHPLSRKDVVEEMMSLVLGGTDAMAYTVTQALILLGNHPEIQRDVRCVAEKAAESHGTCPEANVNTTATEYVRRIVTETMRMYPAVPFSAKISRRKSVMENGMSVPAGTRIMWMKTAVGRNDRVFSQPEAFKPSRFEGKSDAVSTAAFLPFGAGARHCVGSRFAEENCVSFLRAVLMALVVEPAEDVEVSYTATISIRPSAIPVTLTLQA